MKNIEKRITKERIARRSESFEAHEDYTVVGYAALWDPYVLFEDGGNEVYEKVNKEAFDNADMTDVIFQFDHYGMVFARQSNGTLKLEIDDVGLKVTADLGKTTKSKEMYEDIKSGNIKEMSWAFTVEEQAYNSETRTITIAKVKKVYDVSAVGRGANSSTNIESARNLYAGVAEGKKRRERAHQEAIYNYRLQLIKLEKEI